MMEETSSAQDLKMLQLRTAIGSCTRTQLLGASLVLLILSGCAQSYASDSQLDLLEERVAEAQIRTGDEPPEVRLGNLLEKLRIRKEVYEKTTARAKRNSRNLWILNTGVVLVGGLFEAQAQSDAEARAIALGVTFASAAIEGARHEFKFKERAQVNATCYNSISSRIERLEVALASYRLLGGIDNQKVEEFITEVNEVYDLLEELGCKG